MLPIRNQYTIACTPSNPPKPGAYHAIQVIVKEPHHGKLTVRTRAGYRTPNLP